MIPIVTPTEMAAIDDTAPEPVEELIQRAGAALARTALNMLGGGYGRRVTVVAGKGNNGADGVAAARRLQNRGVRVAVVDPTDRPGALPAAHLVIDAAYGTGLQRPYHPPRLPVRPDNSDRLAPVLAADIASGVNGLTGEIHGEPWTADRTVTFGALKPGLLLHPGARYCGKVTVAPIGLDTSAARSHLVTAADVNRWLPIRPPTAHKWQTACWVIAGSPGMTGAAHLAAAAAMRAGSGYVRLSTPGLDHDPTAPTEVVGHPLPAGNWAAAIPADDLARFRAALIGPGLGRRPDTVQAVRDMAPGMPLPLVVDGDGLSALGPEAAGILARRAAPTVITPHDGEFCALTGTDPGVDRFAAGRSLATATGAIVLLKGPTTVVANPDGATLAINNGDQRLATAGTGDVLAGMICGLLSTGVSPMTAAATAAWLHSQAANTRPAGTMVASDLLLALPKAWEAASKNKNTPTTTVSRPLMIRGQAQETT
ncbi:NAD(P)H-hydrate dehydratase [Candidatus Poriferisocius sp.]|uniref:NAD(P)H-hydrate dehydratase n=1 Tax=Candidatus Poriferisocius sp. TaxID=3101276 RepID=UPI003B029BEA